ncbi:unnamed protein product [Phytomonas sp. EM1]|nr:unnamed protein product [Phytomonas sp. EM1]|eukprot:CCW60704.1 unnamed protein product [Phytomonas sp. isolate EM1]
MHEGEEPHAKADLHFRRDWYSNVATFIAGGVAGAASRTLTAPLDRIKLILQEGHLVEASGKSARHGCKHPSLFYIARMIKADGGWRAFWRGNLVNCLKAGPEFAIVFSLRRYYSSLYEDYIDRETERIEAAFKQAEESGLLKGEINRRRLAIESGASVFIPPLNHFICLSHVPRLVVNFLIGAGAGIGAQSILYPMEVIKTRVCVSKTGEFKGGVRQIARSAYQQGGTREFYRGFVPNMAGILIYRGLEMGLYSSAQQWIMIYRMQWLGMSRHDSALSTAEIALTGLVASGISQTVSYPLNVVRTRLQTQGSNGRNRHYTGMTDCFVKMVRSKGVSSLFSGLTANYLKAIPASTIIFIAFEKMQQLLLGDD